MKQNKQDRRSLRTRRLVSSAMMELLLEKRYEAITVRDILHRANIGSSTFYAHYFDKEDVQTSLIEQLVTDLTTPLSDKPNQSDLIPSLELFHHIQDHAQRFQALAQAHALGQIWELAQNTMSEMIERSLIQIFAENRSPAIPASVVAQYVAGAFMNLLKWWIEAEMPYTAEHMGEIFRQLAWSGIQATIEGKIKKVSNLYIEK